MNLDLIPIWVIFVATIIIMVIAVEMGYKLGQAAIRRLGDEKESSVSSIVSAVLGLVAFMLAFTFGIVANRYDARKLLVRDEANTIGVAYLRSDSLPEPDRSEAQKLLRKYVDYRLSATQSRDLHQMSQALIESKRIQNQLWKMAVVNARKDMNSDVAALYIDSLNEMINLHASRVAVGLQARIPDNLWLALYTLIILGMIGIGYQIAIANSKRSWTISILAVSFSLVISLIASLDRPFSGFVLVSQQPLVDLRSSMDKSEE